MRRWTLVLSIVFHLGLIGSIVVAPLFATDVLPPVPRAFEYVRVVASLPPEPAVAPRRQPVQPSSTAAPLQPPDRIDPEPAVDRAPQNSSPDVSFGLPEGSGAAFVPGAIVSGDPLPEPPVPPKPKEPIRVGGVVRPPARLVYVAPKYPPLALSARIQGVVILDAVISPDGSVRDVRVLKSPHALLETAALEAVRQWRFTPPMLNGEAIPVVMTVTVSFTAP